jgi:hypothetical protein
LRTPNESAFTPIGMRARSLHSAIYGTGWGVD